MSKSRREPKTTVSDGSRILSYSEILIFWLPLGMMWIMMAAEQPALNAIIARLPDAETNLAAFGVVFVLSLVIESPIIQMLAAATAIADNAANYRMLMRFMHLTGIVLTAIHLLVALTPLYDLIVTGLLGVPPEVTEASRIPFIIMTPFTMAVGYRRLWQGVLIRRGRTWIVPITMISRLGLIAVVLAIGYVSGRLSGAMLASIALSSGVIAAAITTGVLNRVLVTRALKEPTEGDRTYSWRGLLRFYAPLSLTTIVFLAAQPVLTFGIARSLEPARSLAVWPVVNAYMFLFTSIALSHQETAIALLNRSPRSFTRLSRFTLVLAISLSALMLFTGLTPIGSWWFRAVSGLGEPLLPLTTVPVLILSLVPALMTYKAWYRARYVTANRTTVLAQGVIAYSVALFLCILAGSLLPMVGVTVAALALTISQGIENGYLLVRQPGGRAERHLTSDRQ